MQFPPNVERWRPIVQKYFPPELVDKALWVIQYESGGDPVIRGDNGVAIGLFQIQDNNAFSNRPSAEQLSNPEFNIAYAANQLGAAGGNFAAWGENNLYNGKSFGALGNHPYPSTASNARVTTSRGVQPVSQQQASKKTPPRISLGAPEGQVKGTLAATAQPAGAIITDRSGKRQKFEGSPQQRLGALTQAVDQAWLTLDEYILGSDKSLVADDASGMVYIVDPTIMGSNGPAIIGVDQEGTRLLREATSLSDQSERLFQAFEDGLYQTAEENMGAWLRSEQGKSGEAEREYSDAMGRISDIFNIEDQESQQGDRERQAMAEAADYHIASKKALEQGINIGDMQNVGPGPGARDTTGYKNMIRSTLPSILPSYRRIPDAAFDQAAGLGGGAPTAGGTGAPSGAEQIVLGPSGFTPESFIANILNQGKQKNITGSIANRLGFEGY